jgi:hypothetical protein
MTERQGILNEIDAERERQDKLWGPQNHCIKPNDLNNYFSLVSSWSKRNYALATSENRLTWYEVLKEEFDEVFATQDPEEQGKELIQLGAVAEHMIECIDLQIKGDEDV